MQYLRDQPDRNQTDANAMELLGRLSGFSGFSFDPLALIKLVSYFCRLGESLTFQALQQYCEHAEHETRFRLENALLAARLLYVPIDRHQSLPRLALGSTDLDEPQPPSGFPLFPVHILASVPYLLIGGYVTGGEIGSPMDYIRWCARHCCLRSESLVPASDPLAVLGTFLDSNAWKQLKPKEYHNRMLLDQALRMTPSASADQT